MAAQEGSAAIFIFLGFGAGPSSLTVPLTEPTVAKSTGAAAGVTAGAFSVVSSFLPQLSSENARAAAMTKYNEYGDLIFKYILLLNSGQSR